MTAIDLTYQKDIDTWTLDCFGAQIGYNADERNHRFLEESLELVQSLGATRKECHDLVDYVFGREAGEPMQEVGGVVVCLAALCNAHRLGMVKAAHTELDRIRDPEIMEKIRAKHARKPKFGRLKSRPDELRIPSGPVAETIKDFQKVDGYLNGGSIALLEAFGEFMLDNMPKPDPWAPARAKGTMLPEQERTLEAWKEDTKAMLEDF